MKTLERVSLKVILPSGLTTSVSFPERPAVPLYVMVPVHWICISDAKPARLECKERGLQGSPMLKSDTA